MFILFFKTKFLEVIVNISILPLSNMELIKMISHFLG